MHLIAAHAACGGWTNPKPSTAEPVRSGPVGAVERQQVGVGRRASTGRRRLGSVRRRRESSWASASTSGVGSGAPGPATKYAVCAATTPRIRSPPRDAGDEVVTGAPATLAGVELLPRLIETRPFAGFAAPRSLPPVVTGPPLLPGLCPGRDDPTGRGPAAKPRVRRRRPGLAWTVTIPTPSPRAAGASRGASGGVGLPTALFQGQTPLAVRMRPTSLDEVAGQGHLLRPGSPLVTLADPDASAVATSVILWGRRAPARPRSPRRSPARPGGGSSSSRR